MRPRIKVGVLVASTNRTKYIKAKRLTIEYLYIEKLGGNKIIKTIIK